MAASRQRNVNYPAPARGPSKLNPEQRDQLLWWLAEGWSSVDLAERMREEWGIEYKPQSIRAYKMAHADEVARRQELLRQGLVQSIPSTNAYHRLARLHRIAEHYYKRRRYQEFARIAAQIADEMERLERRRGASEGPAQGAQLTIINQVQASAMAQSTSVQATVQGPVPEEVQQLADWLGALIESGGPRSGADGATDSPGGRMDAGDEPERPARRRSAGRRRSARRSKSSSRGRAKAPGRVQ